MQGLHHQQQQLAGLLSVALSTTAAATATDSSTTSTATTATAPPESDDSNRLAAINSLRRLIIYPPNSLLVTHSASFLSQGFSQLLSDKSYSLRQAAATSYGALCSVLSSIPLGSSGRQNHVVDRFINWALPLLSNVSANDGSTELALESLREFLSVGDVGAIERYAFPILKACQELLEDERTSMNLLHQLLAVLTVISLKFFRCFQPHFIDIVDLLLGWAMVPDLAEGDRRVIMSSFLQFQKYWVSNLQFPLGLLSKFLGDMDMLLQDGSAGTPQQFQRLLALFSCFSAVLQSTASGLLEMNRLEQIIEPLSKMIPQLLGCLSLLGKKFGWSKWLEDSWRCLTLLAEILGERFSNFYTFALDVLFESLDVDTHSKTMRSGKVSSFQIHGVLKTNLQLLSLQKLGLLPASVHKILQWDAPISRLRLHPNHLVTSSAAATYVFLLQHGNDEVVEHSINLLFEELELVKGMLENFLVHGGNSLSSDSYSRSELCALFRFDLKVLLTCICFRREDILSAEAAKASLLLKRSENLASSVVTRMSPFQFIKDFVELQVTTLETLGWITSVELLSKCSIQLCERDSSGKITNVSMNDKQFLIRIARIIVEHFKKYNDIFVKALDTDSPLAVKVNALDWMCKSCEDVSRIYGILEVDVNPYDDLGYNSSVWSLVACVLGAALDKEPEVRLKVTVVFDKLVQAKLVDAGHFYQIGELVLEKLGDPDMTIRSAFVNLFSRFLPVTIYLFGSSEGAAMTPGTTFYKIGNRQNLHWRHVFALKQMPQRLQQQQLVSILSYISQRWKAPLSSWIQRFIQLCSYAKDSTQGQLEETGSSGENSLWMDVKFGADVLERSVLVNNLAGVWWAIHEAARYCTGTRLRTNLGGPTQTFAALERMLLDVAHMLQLDAEHTDGNVSVIGSSGARLLPMRLLLDFVEALKKNVYNAYEGSFVLPSVTRQSSLFFRANKKVCEEWFSRICEPMMNAGLALQCHDATIQYCSLRLQELRNSVISLSRDKSRVQVIEIPHNARDRLSGDVVRIVRLITLALSKKHDPAALIGLQKWLNLTFSLLFEGETQFAEGYQISGPFSWITGLVYQAGGQYEKAAAFFTQLLQEEETLASMGSDGIQFTIGRVIESYTAISDWVSLEAWLLELQALRATHAGKSYSGALTTAGNEINAIHALGHFDEGDIQSTWASLDLTPKSSSELTLDPKLALQRSEQMLLQGLLHKIEGKMDMVPDEMQKAKSMLGEILTVLPLDSLSEAAPFSIHLHCICALEEVCRLNQIQEKPKESVTASLLQAAQLPMNVINQDCNSWLKLFRVYKTILPVSAVTLHLCKNMIRLSRKQRNLGLANRLRNYLKGQINNYSETNCHKSLVPCLRYEEILLMFAENKLMDAYSSMWSYVSSCFLSQEHSCSDADDSLLKAKACLKLSTWLKRDHPDFSVENFVSHILSDFNGSNNKLTMEDTHTSNSSTYLVIEEIIGSAAKLSTRLCPMMGKSWISYASWCFSQAEESLSSSSYGTVLRSCSFSSVLEPELLPHRFSLTEDEISKVTSIISGIFQKHSSSGDERRLWVQWTDEMISSNHVTLLVQKVVNVIETAAGAPGVENFSGDSLYAAVNSQLRTALLDGNFHMEENTILSSLNDLVDIWWSLRKRRVSLFGHAAHGFIQYLSHSSSRLGGFPSIDSGGSLSQKSGSLILRAVLYILHILLNYGLELKDTLESDLSAVPLLPWQEITPQLFARLGCHPETKIRKQLEGLLMMLAKSSPWSIVYPTLVDLNTSSEQPSEELEHILDCLTKLYPKLVQDVKLMIHELGNVTVLWEELWLSTLQDLHGDVMRRINLLKEEALRIAQNVNLSNNEKVRINAAKYSAMMAPIVVALERRLALISRKPETPHEKWFQNEYKELIKSAIIAFKTPPTSPSALADVWKPFDSIAASLASCQRKSGVSLQEVAPQLASLSSSDIPMPGLEKQVMISETERDFCSSVHGIVSVSSFSEQVTILSTKTKPKKLVMLGSDGGKYTYLLKGREDLRLDARIMQLLQAVNRFLLSHSETKSCSIGIRYYSVTPISGRAGLIQWVDNVISIYSIFKSWQQRVQLAQLLATSGNLKNTVPPPVPRPSDMFYGKIIPALKEKGIKRVISRRDWPHEVKLKVLLDLMEETPKQLLHQELWCSSEGFGAFSSKLKRYSGSLAAMSMVGHILGLGDRHLDNILIDLSSGDIVHIDYNVCFDKGQRLKVPEIVPFRLTQTLEAALGLTGIEGVFRENCEAVIGVLKRNKDILLMLLEVFIWDPLVEWMRGDFHDDAAIGGEERKGMELAVSLSLFASRVQEIRVPLQEHHDILLGSAPAVESALERFLNILNQYEIVSAIFYRADQERATLHLHETSAKSLVAEATSHLDKTRALYEVQAREFSQAKAAVTEKAQEATTWLDQHARILDALRGDSISEIKFSIQKASMENDLSLISAVSAAGVPLTIVPEPTQAQCCEIDKEVSHLIAELDHGVSCAITSLQNYSLALLRILPLNYIASSSVHSWAQVLQLSVNAISPDMLSLARRQAGELIAKAHGDTLDFVRHSRDDLSLKMKRYALEIERLEGEYAGLLNSIGSEAESKAKERLLSAFMKYTQSSSFGRNEDLFPSLPPSQGSKDVRDLDSKKEKMFSVLSAALCSLYEDVKYKVLDILNNSAAPGGLNTQSQSDLGIMFCGLEEQIGKCVLIRDFANELRRSVGNGPATSDLEASEESWASIFKATLVSCRELFVHMIELILPEVIKSVVSIDSEVMDAFGALSAIRGSIETALEQLLEVEVERGSLEELKKSYFVKVGLITEQQLALEEAAIKGRDHLSWEEAEELASQEEACREQLDQLHHTWNQKDARSSSLMKKEAHVKDALVASERQFLSLLDSREDRMVRGFRSKALLSLLGKPFAGLESMDKALFTYYGPCPMDISTLADSFNSGCPVSEYIWKFKGLLNGSDFFAWKVAVMDMVLDLTVHDVSSSVDQNLGMDELVDAVKKKLLVQLQVVINQYLKERIAPILFCCLEKEIENLNQQTERVKELGSDRLKKDTSAVRKLKAMIEEYCNAHETVRAARSAASLMQRQVTELKECIRRASQEIIQIEWMHDVSLSPSNDSRFIAHKYLDSDDKMYSHVLNISRPNLLESMQSAVSKIANSFESLQSCERTSLTAEGQLERAMNWACGGSNSSNSSNKSIGIPPEFHDHLKRRRQLLWEAQEKASDIMKLSLSILKFEASRDGILSSPGEIFPYKTSVDGRAWQQAYLNALTRLELAFHSLSRAEKEYKVAQNSMEAASNGLISASNELSMISLKSKSTSDDLQSTLLQMRDCAHETSIALSGFSRAARGHTALTSECGSMLEEVLAITDGLHDVHNLGKEAAAVHRSLMECISKACEVILPLESVLSKDVAAMTDAMNKERETKKEIAPIHGQAIYQSYCPRVKTAFMAFKPLVPFLMSSVKELYSLVTKLAQSASLHAGDLHKAAEAIEGSQEADSQEIDLSGGDIENVPDFDDLKETFVSESDAVKDESVANINLLSSQDREWISPPDSMYSSSESDSISGEESPSNGLSLPDSNHNDDKDQNKPLSSDTDHHNLQLGLSQSNNEVEIKDEDIDSSSDTLSNVPTDGVSSSNKSISALPDTLEQENLSLKLDGGDEETSETRVGAVGESQNDQVKKDGLRITRGKNVFAMSVLRRIEMKLDGRDISENRNVSIGEQVDYLLKQATSADNLCNMYEGWTPWI